MDQKIEWSTFLLGQNAVYSPTAIVVLLRRAGKKVSLDFLEIPKIPENPEKKKKKRGDGPGSLVRIVL